ncbi:MAG: type I-E CRISPR-associated protein Cas6/Cse3/CasE [Thermoleophilia bacterium]
MFLSRLMLDSRSPAVRRDLADRHGLHRSVMCAFPDVEGDEARGRLGVLFRIESGDGGRGLRLYVQSAEVPDWSRLSEGYLLSVPENPACRPLEAAYECLKDGAVLSFTLAANPTRKVGTTLKSEREAGHKENGKRVPIRDPLQQVEWLVRKGEQGGFELLPSERNGSPDVALREEPMVRGRRSGTGLSLCCVVYRGHLRISNREAFMETLRGGVGPGKAYGLGLMLIAPAHSLGHA